MLHSRVCILNAMWKCFNSLSHMNTLHVINPIPMWYYPPLNRPIFILKWWHSIDYDYSWQLAEWRSGSVSALPCWRPGFGPRTRLRKIFAANNCTMQGQNNWGNWGSPGVMKLRVAWEVLRWLMKFRELCSGGFHPKLVTPPYHGFLNMNTPTNSQNSKRH